MIPSGWDIRLPDDAFGECRASEYLASRGIEVVDTFTTLGFESALEIPLRNNTADDVTVLIGAPLILFTAIQYMTVDLAIVTGSFRTPSYAQLPDSTTQNN